jgi:hypothetical protein
MRAVHRRVATGRTDSALTSARGPSGCLRSCHRAHRLWAGRHASVPLCFCSSFSSAQTTPCHLSAGCSGPEGLFRTPFRFRLFEVRSAFCPRSLLVSLSHRRKGSFGGSQAQSNHRPSIGGPGSSRALTPFRFSRTNRCFVGAYNSYPGLVWSGLSEPKFLRRLSFSLFPYGPRLEPLHTLCHTLDRTTNWPLCVLRSIS